MVVWSFSLSVNASNWSGGLLMFISAELISWISTFFAFLQALHNRVVSETFSVPKKIAAMSHIGTYCHLVLTLTSTFFEQISIHPLMTFCLLNTLRLFVYGTWAVYSWCSCIFLLCLCSRYSATQLVSPLSYSNRSYNAFISKHNEQEANWVS